MVVVKVKVNTVLNDSVGLIQSGGVVQLTDYVPLYFHYKNYQQISKSIMSDQKPAAVSPEDRSMLTRGFASAIAIGDTFVPNFPLFHQPIVQVIAKSVARKTITASATKYTP